MSEIVCSASVGLPGHAFGLDMHPTRPVLAAGLITGQVKLYDYSASSVRQASSARPHEGSCRSVRFSEDGAHVFSVGADGSLQQRDVATNKRSWRKQGAHATAINAMVGLGAVGVATGDDEGAVHMWDVRTRKKALSFQENSDFIGDLLFSEARGGPTLAAASGDGMLSVFDLRAGRLWARSDPLDDELHCLALLKGGRKLAVGTESGVVGIFSWGDFGDVSDRMVGHPHSVDCMAALSETHMLTGSSDGLIRLVSIHPNQVVGVVGDHEEHGVERLALRRGEGAAPLLASCGHDDTIRLWDLAYLDELDDDDGDDGEGEGGEVEAGGSGEGGEAAAEGAEPGRRDAKRARKAVRAKPQQQEEAGSDSDSDSESESSEPEEVQRGRKKPKPIVKGNAAIKLGSNFFGGL